MKLAKSEKEFLRAVKKCKTKSFYNEVRWNLSTLVNDQKKGITNSIKSSFSRGKKNLISKKLIDEIIVSPMDLSDDEFIQFAVHSTDSSLIKGLREVLIPIILKRNKISEFGEDYEELSTAEKHILSYRHWGSMKAEDINTREAEEKLRRIHSEIYSLIAPLFSSFVTNKETFYVDDLEKLFAELLQSIHSTGFNYCIWKLLDTVRLDFEEVLPEAFFLEVDKYERVLSDCSVILKRHRRRVFLDYHVKDAKKAERFEKGFYLVNFGREELIENRKRIHNTIKENTLKRYFLKPSDFDFIQSIYEAWSSDELNLCMDLLLSIPNGDVRIIELNKELVL